MSKGSALLHLEQANDARVLKARCKQRIASGELNAGRVIADPPDYMRSARLAHVLLSVRWISEKRMRSICHNLGLDPYAKLRELKVRERLALMEVLS